MNNEVEILLVDDSMSDAGMTIRALKKNNLTNKLLHLKDGAEALDFIFSEGKYEGRRAASLPKVILLDLKMPRVNGIEVLARIKSEEQTKRIPVVILTSSREHSDVETCYKLGANSYTVKPVDFDEFQKVVSDVGLYWTTINT